MAVFFTVKTTFHIHQEAQCVLQLRGSLGNPIILPLECGPLQWQRGCLTLCQLPDLLGS